MDKKDIDKLYDYVDTLDYLSKLEKRRLRRAIKLGYGNEVLLKELNAILIMATRMNKINKEKLRRGK